MAEHFTQAISESYLKKFYRNPGGFGWSYETLDGYTEYASIRKQEVVVEWIRGLRPSSVLDLGCGAALISRELARNGIGVTAVDINENLLSRIQECPQVRFLAADGFALSFKTDSFDLVLASEVLEHFQDISGVLDEMKRVLKVRGKILITVPNLHCYDGLEGKWKIVSKMLNFLNRFRKKMRLPEIYPYGYNTHLQKKSPFQWKETFVSHGFRVVRERPVFISPYLPRVFKSLGFIEDMIYGSKRVFRLQGLIERYLCRYFPFSSLGQLHLFECEKK